jgi:DNA-directed RNA polymerase specialized sigma24 family protein
MKPKKPKKTKSKKNVKKVERYEDHIEVINEEIAKKRCKWNLTTLAWMDYEDISQMLRFHIFKKWHLYDTSKNLKPWIRTIISNQIKNLVRNHYTNFIKPCNKCEAAHEETGCKIYKKQCSDCPLYKNWEKNKKTGFAAKMPMPLESHKQEVNYIQNNPSIDIERSAKILHTKMKEVLKPHEWKIYQYLYINNLDELDAAKKMGYRTSEKNRSPGYKQIKSVKKKIITKVKEILQNDEIDIW